VAQKPKKRPAKARERGEAREQRRRAIAAGIVNRKPVSAIADDLGLSREWVSKEANRPETQDLIRSMLAPHRKRLERIVDRAVSGVERALDIDQVQRAQRIAWLTERIEQLRTVLKERSEDPSMQGVAGGKTGMLVHRKKSIGAGPTAEIVDEYEVDAGTLRELRAHEEQLRDELNDFTPNLKAVERARDLLNLAEGRTDGDSDSNARRFAGTMEDLLSTYRSIAGAAVIQ
jgi:hypothetical protein